MEYILDYLVYNVLKYKVLIMFKFIRYVRVMKIFIYCIVYDYYENLGLFIL